jgi:Salmonella virulence plasmid 65kDa B protein/Insecticide toxin TcdB middle/N-terminal region
MANRHASHPASEFVSTRGAPANIPVTAATHRRPYRLGGVLRWGAGEAGGLRLVRRAVALSMAVLLTLLPVMQTAAAAENARVATTAETTRVAALAPVRLPLEVAPPAFTIVATGAAASLAHDGAEVKVPVGALATGGLLSIRPLAAREVARMNPGLINATRGPRRGYRMEPSGHFDGQVALTLPYDRHLLPEGRPERDLRIFWYDTAKKRWTPLQRSSVDARDQTVTGWTDHFTDFITGVVNVPDHPQVEGFTPTMFSGMKAADPGAKINLIEAPQANSTGDANLSYPIEVPPGRNGHQPSLAITYNSSSGNGWLGNGWSLGIPSIDIDTRWGVPRYDTGQIDGTAGGLETETYMLNGAQLAPVANRGALVPRTAEKSFSQRVEAQFLRIVRHGSSPTTYWWEVTAKDGTRSLFGGSPSTGVDPQAVLSDPNSANGNIGRWMLREVIDPNGNNITFHYNVVNLTFNGPEPARQIYPSSINYTGRTGGADGPYQVVFKRDSVRTDPIVDGRLGFKTVTTDRLTEIDVNLTSATTPLIRSYTLAYITGQFSKSLLQTMTQNGTDGSAFNTHTFSYFDDIGNGTFNPTTPLTVFAPPHPGGIPTNGDVPGGDGLTSGSGLVGDVNGTAFSGEGNSSGQTHLYVGIAIGPEKQLSGGVKVGGNTDTSHLSAILLDLNGDGLLDQVFLNGNTVSWVRNTGTPGAPSFSTTPQAVSGLTAINRSSGFTFTAGGEIYAGAGPIGAAEMLDQSFTRTSESVYFTDVNGDGLPDLVSGGAVLFNQGPDANGNPFFAPKSPTPLGPNSASPNTAGLIAPPSSNQQTAAQSAFAVVDSVRRWVAPFTGTINVTGQVALTQTGDSTADGVRAAVQLENSELFSVTISDPTDLTPKPITGLTGIPVIAGQRLYFRVNSRNDGAFDTVSFDPTIAYTAVNGAAVDPTTLDESGLPVFVTTASTDFAFAGRPMPVNVPVSGTATITGTIFKPNVTTDDVTFVITQNGTPVFLQTIPAGSTLPANGVPITLPSSPLTLSQNDQLLARITSNTRVNLSGIAFTPTLAYQTINGGPAPKAADGTPQLAILMPATAQLFGMSTSGTPQTAFIAPGGPVQVTQTVSGSGPAGLNGQITLAAKSGGVLLAKQVVSIMGGVISGPAALNVTLNLPAGAPVFFTAEATSPAILANFTVSAPTDAAGDVLPFDTRVDTSVNDPFAGGYRNWWFADYTPSDTGGTAPIDQTLLRFPTTAQDPVLSQFFGMLPNEAGTPPLQILTANPPNAPPNPPQVLPRWQARSDNAFVAGGLMGSTRLGDRVPNLTDGTGLSFAGAAGITKTGSSTNTAVSGTFTMGLSFGVGTANGTNGSDIDFIDFNGDGYPDVVAGGSVQPTLPNGALGSQRIGLAGQSQVRQNAQSNFDVNLGATTSNLRSASNTFPLNIFSEQAPYNVSAGVQASEGTSAMNYDLVDVNGDGLPDLVQPTGSGLIVQLNLGYRFGLPETWNASGPVRNEQTAAFGFNAGAGISGPAGFTDAVYGFGGGIASTHNMTGTDFDIIDVNGDGLPDLVTKPVSVDPVAASVTSTSTAVTVNLNSGAGFLPAQTWNGALPVPIQSRATVNRNLGLHFTISFPLPTILAGVPLFMIINPGHNHGDSFGGSRSQVRDFDGDGYADHIAINTNNDGSDATVTVHLNQRGRTNLLKSITRPLGATIALDYVRAGNTPDLPQNRWVMASRTVFDGLAGDGADFQIATFDYQNGQWNRAERTFYGFATVTEQQRDTTGVTTANIGTTAPASLPVFRSIIESFRTDSFYTKGLLAQQITQDGAGNRFLETDQTYNVVTVPNGTSVPGLEDFTATRFPQFTQRNSLFFEGQATAGQQISETFAYDGFGNVINYADLGDAGTAPVFSAISYTASTPACVTSHIVGIANSVTVTDASGNVLRKRQADVDCTTGNVTENRRFLADGSVSATDMTYDGEGKLTAVTGPANLNGERYRLTYAYDTTVDIYVGERHRQFPCPPGPLCLDLDPRLQVRRDYLDHRRERPGRQPHL